MRMLSKSSEERAGSACLGTKLANVVGKPANYGINQNAGFRQRSAHGDSTKESNFSKSGARAGGEELIGGN